GRPSPGRARFPGRNGGGPDRRTRVRREDLGLDGEKHHAAPPPGLNRIDLWLPFIQGTGGGCAAAQAAGHGARRKSRAIHDPAGWVRGLKPRWLYRRAPNLMPDAGIIAEPVASTACIRESRRRT